MKTRRTLVNRRRSIALACTVASLGSPPLLADTAALWDGTANNWSSAAHWSSNPNVPNNGVPAGTLYDVTISSGTVTLDINPTIQLLALTNGTINGAGNLSIAGTFSWSAGTLSGSGAYTTNNANISLTTSFGMGVTASLLSTGNVNFTSTAGFSLNLAAGNTYTSRGAFAINTINGASWNGGVFNNAGNFTKTSSDTNNISSLFNNTGNVSIGSGTVNFTNGGAHTGSFGTTGSGAIGFSGTHNFNTGSSVTGGNLNFNAGTDTFNNGSTYNTGTGTLSVNGATVSFLPGASLSGANGTLAIASSTLNLNTGTPLTFNTFKETGGTLAGADNVTISGNTTLSGGTLGGTGSLTVKDLAISLSSSVTFSGSRSLLSTGNTTWTSTAGFSVTAAATNTFTSQGNFTANTTGSASWNSGIFNNAGNFTKNSNDTNTISAQFNNNGTVSVANGTLNLSGGGTHTGSFGSSGNGTLTFSGGIDIFNAGSVVNSPKLNFSGANSNFGAGSTLSSLGTVSLSSSFLALNTANNPSVVTFIMTGGTLSGADPFNVTANMTWSGGTLGGTGTVTVKDMNFSMTNGLAMSNSESLFSTGNSTWTSTSGFALTATANNTYTNQGALSINTTGNPGWTGGTFLNSGTITKTSNDNNTISALFNNSGNVTTSNGILSFTGGGNQTGSFSATGAAVLSFGGTQNFNANSSITSGNINFTTGNISFNSGSTYNAATGTTTVAGGTVNFLAGTTITSLGTTLSISSGTLNLASGANPVVTTLSVTGGSLIGSDALSATSNMTWSGGTLGGAGSLTVKDLAINLTNGVTMNGSRSLTSTGTAIWTSTAGFSVTATANNTYTSQGNFTINTIGNPAWNNGILNNAGAFSKISTDNNTISATFNNSGNVSVSNGTLTLSGGGTQTGSFFTSGTGILSFGGNHNFDAGAAFNAGFFNFSSGNSTFHPGATYNASGTTTVSGAAVNFLAGTTLSSFGTTLAISGGNLTLNTGGPTPTVPSFNATGGTLSGTDNLSVTNLMTWGANTLTGVGSVTTKDLNISLTGGTATLSGTRTLTSTGNTTWSSTAGFSVSLTTNNAFTTLGNFTLNTIGNAAFSGGTFHNAGAFSKISPDNNVISAAFDNTGSLALNAGNLSLTGGDTGSTTGTFSVVFGSTLTLGGNYALAPAAALSGAGNLILQGGNITINSNVTTTGNTTVSAGTIHFAGAQSLYNPNSLAITAGSAIFTNDAAKLLSVTGLTLSGSNNAWGSSLDLGNNRAIVAPPVTASRATILAILENQASFGVSHTNGIHSSTHPATFGLAVLDNTITNFSTFGGQPVDANSILLGLELLGDSNADGHVDLTDLSTVLNNFGTVTAAWMNGNFDGATTIDLSDLSAVLNNFGLSNPNPSTSQDSALSPQNAPLVPTPEPASLFIPAASLLLLRKRK